MQCKMRYLVNGGVVCVQYRRADKQKRQRVVGFVGVGRRIGQAVVRSMQKEPRAQTLES